ncbi:MAG: sugar phosphate isomerase/epimerase [Gemmataceae bacterium]
MIPLSRREWLAASVAAVLPAEPPIALGFSLYGMKSLPLPDAIEACAAIGYDGVELALMPGYAAEPKRLAAADRKTLRMRLTDAKLKLHGLMENLAEPASDADHAKNLDRLKAAAELGHALSPGTPPPIETILGGKPADWGNVKDRLVQRLGGWAKVAADAKTVIAVKPHVGNALHLPADAVWLVKQVNSPWLKLAYDFSHYLLRGLKLGDTMDAILPHTAFIHVKDAKGSAEKFEFLLPGEHGIDYADYAKSLREAKCRVPVVVEVSGMISNKPGYDPVQAAKTSYKNLAAGFGR